MCQSRDKGLDILYCGKWRKIDLDLDQTMPNVELVGAIFVVIIVIMYTDTHTRTHTHTHTHTKTQTHTGRNRDRHDYSIVVVDKLQLY